MAKRVNYSLAHRPFQAAEQVSPKGFIPLNLPDPSALASTPMLPPQTPIPPPA